MRKYLFVLTFTGLSTYGMLCGLGRILKPETPISHEPNYAKLTIITVK